MHEEHPDGELVARARAGEAAAFTSLCERHRNRVWRIVASVARGSDVEDLAQEAVVRAYRSLHTYTGEASFAAWLCRIALNAAHDHHKSAWRRRVTLFERHPEEHHPAPESLEGTVERRELQRRVRQAVATLPEGQRAPIWLHYFEGFSVVEIARLEGIPEATMRSRIRAGLQRLSRSLGDLMPAPDSAIPLGVDPNGCGA